MNKSQEYEYMQCPKCRSHNTQSVSVAHKQSVRTGDNGYQSISEFGRGLEPPPPRSEFAFPLGIAYMIGFLMFFSSSELARKIGVWLPTIADFINRRPFIFSTCVGLLAGLIVSISAIGFNVSTHRNQMDEWSKGIVCRRCGHRFSRGPLNGTPGQDR